MSTSIDSKNAEPDDCEFTREVKGYFSRLEAAFNELHEAVVRHIRSHPGGYLAPHPDYPRMSILDNGFPSFHESGIFDDAAPKDYVSAVRPRGLGALMIGHKPSIVPLPKTDDLAEFLRTHAIGKRFQLPQTIPGESPWNWAVESLVYDAVARYLHLYGLESPLDSGRRHRVLAPLMVGTVFRPLRLRLMVPITLTSFGIDHFRLSETAYIIRIPEKLQLARARMSTMGTGAAQMVVGAATHAFVSTDWQLDVESIGEVVLSLNQSSSNVLDAIDSFFGALRVATGIRTGYAQMVWIPRRWALGYFCNLPPIYGTALRSYPEAYDRYGWTQPAQVVSVSQLNEVRRIYGAVVSSNSEAVRLSLRRLNQCLTRTDAADAILDATIGLELLLGDDENQSLSYKLRLRAGSLASLRPDLGLLPKDVAAKVKRLYEARSSIVHGRRRKRSKAAATAADSSHADDRAMAADVLRFVLDVLLTHPEYQQPGKIDDGLLLRSGDDTQPPSQGQFSYGDAGSS